MKELWHKLSRNGLRDDEGIFSHREVILLNKILLVTPIVLVFLLPVEIYINGVTAIPLDLTFIGLMVVPFLMQRYRYFWAAKFFSFVASNLFILGAGLMVGKGINNHIAMIPIMLFGMILFKSTRDRVLVFGISLAFFVSLRYLLDIVPPHYTFTPSAKEAFSIVFYIMALLVTFLLGYYFLNINKEYETTIVSQSLSIATKNKEITDSIIYAKRIQEAQLPNKNEIYSALPDCFVLYKPKDIVSGDFYYFHKNEHSVFIASADCTGHGVPGALMSMIGTEKLNDAFLHTNNTSEILQYLNNGIKLSLRQTGDDESTRDGMDIALFAVDKKTNVIKFAGANRPLWVIRKGQKNIEEIKSTKKAIGGLTAENQEFETHELKLQPGDTFYICSDGYADTFGGEHSKKLTTKRFKEILLSIQNKTMKEQERFLNQFIEDWKGETEQIDDILVIGVRL